MHLLDGVRFKCSAPSSAQRTLALHRDSRAFMQGSGQDGREGNDPIPGSFGVRATWGTEEERQVRRERGSEHDRLRRMEAERVGVGSPRRGRESENGVWGTDPLPTPLNLQTAFPSWCGLSHSAHRPLCPDPKPRGFLPTRSTLGARKEGSRRPRPGKPAADAWLRPRRRQVG